MPKTKTDKVFPANTKNKVDFLNHRVEELDNILKRTVADYENMERRVKKQQEEYVKYANLSLLSDLLPIFDDLERAQSHLNDQGLNMVISHLHKTLESQGVKKITPGNEPFDHETMEAVETVEGPDNQVISVLSPGYLYHDKVLRHARVIVGQKTDEGPEDTRDNTENKVQ